MEKTMLKAFCEVSNVKRFITGPNCPQIIRNFLPIIEDEANVRGTLMADLEIFLESPELGAKAEKDEEHTADDVLENDIWTALNSIWLQLDETSTPKAPTFASFHGRHKIRGFRFSDAATSVNESIVFFHEGDRMVPGQIRRIFSISGTNFKIGKHRYFFAIHKFKKTTVPRTLNPFDAWPHFGAELWSKTQEDQPVILSDELPIFHSIYRSWDEHTYVMKSTSRVSPHKLQPI
jgi:hypothetical protein